MDNLSIFFIVASFMVLVYFIYIFRTQKRISVIFEILFIGVYVSVLMIFMFPQLLVVIENTLGINSAINFILYLSIFVAYFVIFMLYNKSEKQRQEITKLVREISYIKRGKK